jgi:4'-phosphopantetheinyl transferase
MANSIDISGNSVHVWRVHLDQTEAIVARLHAGLAPDERQRADRFLRKDHARRFVVARAMLRNVLACCLGVDAAVIAFRYEATGKPALAVPMSSDLRFNLSHSGDVAVCAVVAGREVGIDVERRRSIPTAREMARRFFRPEEVAVLDSLTGEEFERAFFACWTRKEAYLKASGFGIGRLEACQVTVRPEEPAALVCVDGDPEAAKRWWLCDLDDVADHAMCLALEGGPAESIHRRTWEA